MIEQEKQTFVETPSEVADLTGDTLRVIQEHYATPSDGEMREAIQKKAII